MRGQIEIAVRARLIDPTSAEFSWPYGFIDGSWKPLIGKRAVGYTTCGYVNSKNRMGGYVGTVPFIVVVDHDQRTIEMLNLADASQGSIIVEAMSSSCQKSSFPSPQDGMLQAQERTAGLSVADEIGKLAKLKDSGVLTQAEFDTQKAKLLNQ